MNVKTSELGVQGLGQPTRPLLREVSRDSGSVRRIDPRAMLAARDDVRVSDITTLRPSSGGRGTSQDI
jgi:hypothetical protein